MNQMVTVACKLYDATGDQTVPQDALLAWNGDVKSPASKNGGTAETASGKGRLGPAGIRQRTSLGRCRILLRCCGALPIYQG